MKKLLLAAAMLGALSAPAYADVLLGGQLWSNTGTTLSLDPTVPGGNQPLNTPCVICGDNQPQQQADFGYTNFKNSGNLSDAIFFSTNVAGGANPGVDTVGIGYDGSFLRAFLLAGGDPNLTFSIGIDVNDTGTAQTLESFFFLDLTSHTIVAAFSPQLGGTLIPSLNNGTGHPDYTLNGLSLDGLDLTHEYAFFARISGANDGPDSFFIVPAAVPGPVAGAGIPGVIAACGGLVAFARRRKKQQEAGVT